MDLGGLRNKGIAAWVRWSVQEQTLVGVLVAAFIVLGALGLKRMNKDEFPTFHIKQGLVVGVYPGASAQEVEEQLAIPLEEFLFTFPEVNRKNSTATCTDGYCYLFIDLLDNIPQTRKDEIWSKIKLGLDTQRLSLPTGVLAIAALDDFSSTSSLLLALQSPDRGYRELEDYAKDLCRRLRDIPETAKATVMGSQQEEIAITLDRDRLSAYGISPAALLLDYQTGSINLPAGSFVHGGSSERISVQGGVGSEEEVASRIVYSDPSGAVVRLRDVAQVERRYKEPSQYVSFNATPCLIINLEMLPDHDIVAYGEEVEKVLQEFRQSVPEDVGIIRVSDQPHVVKTSVWSFLRDLLISMLVVVFVMLMLFPLRSALIASSGVPVCIAIAIAVMSLTGMSLNTVTLAALITTLGMIVDDSIITMDGYMTQTAKGFHGVDAAAKSARELFTPTLMATLAISLMFFPIEVLITGYLGDFVELFPWVVLIALMTSLFYAVTVVPSLEVKFILPPGQEQKKNFIVRGQERFFALLQRFYEGCLAWCFRHPYLTLTGGVLTVALGIFMFSRIHIQMMPKAARDSFVVEMYSQAGTNVATTATRADSLVNLMLEDPRVVSATSFTGVSAPRFVATYAPVTPSPQTVQIIVRTVSNLATIEVLQEFTEEYEHLFPDTRIHFKQMDYQVVPAPVSVCLRGEDREALLEPAQKISAFLSSLNTETQWVHSETDDYSPSLNVVLNADEASRLGVSKGILSLNLATITGGQTLATLWEGEHPLPVNLYSTLGEDYEDLSDAMVATGIPGVNVPLRRVASLEPDWALSSLYRQNGRRSVNISCDLKVGASQPAVEDKLRAFMDQEIIPTLPPDVEVEYQGLSSMNRFVAPQIIYSFLAACLVLFVFLLIHFRKASIAALTMALSLLCLFGASFGLWLFRLDFSITAALGLISLVGIIVRNGILMFEYAEDARSEGGESVHDAALHAGQRRMRPIFLTSCTTALGVLPMILSGDLLWMPMGVVICFGTLLTIFLITLVMPVSYWQLFKNSRKK